MRKSSRFLVGVSVSFLLLVSTFTISLHAELRTVDLGSFSEDSVRLDFRHRGSAGDDASDALADWGIQMAGVAGTVPTLTGWSDYCDGICIIPYIYPVVEMDADESNGPRPLILNSRSPLRRIQLELAHTPSDQPVSLTIRAQDAVGNVLGTYESVMSDRRSFIGLEDSEGRPISRVIVSYGEGRPENLLAVIAEFVERPVFKTYFAQIGDGRLPDGESLTSSIVVTNLSSSTAKGSIEFFDDLGDPLSLEFEEGFSTDRIDLAISSWNVGRWTSTGTSSPVRSGSARITSSVPVAASVRYTDRDSAGRVLAEAGIASSRPEGYQIAPIHRESASGLVGSGSFIDDSCSSAVAIVNPWDEKVSVRFWSGGLYVDWELPPRGHRAKFIEEIVPDLSDPIVTGFLEIWASSPVAATVLHTREGRAHASLPAAGSGH